MSRNRTPIWLSVISQASRSCRSLLYTRSYVSDAYVFEHRGIAARANTIPNSSFSPVNEPSRIFHRSLFQIEGMRRGSRRMHANLRTVSVSGDSSGSSDLDRPGLRAGRKRLRLQAEKYGELVHRHATGRTELLILFVKCHKCHKHHGLSLETRGFAVNNSRLTEMV